MAARRSAGHERTQAISQARAPILTAPDKLQGPVRREPRSRAGRGSRGPAPGLGDAAGYALRVALREPGRRVELLGAQAQRLDHLIVSLVTVRAPGLLSPCGAGPGTAAMLLIAAGDQPGRLRRQAARAHIRAGAPTPAPPGKARRHRLSRGGNGQASHALRPIVITRLSARPATRAYLRQRTTARPPAKEHTRRRTRYAARKACPCLRG